MRTFKDGGPPPSGVDPRQLILVMLAQLGDQDPPEEVINRLLKTDSLVIGYLLRLSDRVAMRRGAIFLEQESDRRCLVQDEDGNQCGTRLTVIHTSDGTTDSCRKCGASWPMRSRS